ncbi:probable cyclin-dependent serine/threonine-protein kinase DDB_G0292550 isoform X4 [Ixodes scapularis]|uniref:probable cyclin-dependent serine/threonine-protein kinase DDB_G0292550 isoform X4 n=1 Tax=Ixodes scapularis TaxID=6945 RepID=UPI001A9D895E|nr:probable cyclin-dependent serine/threonine-protein kinase DDB_G0292550 isoform X4 [Ixodes scapularis]
MTATWSSHHWPRRSCLLVLVVLGLAQTLHAEDRQETSADARGTKRDYCVVGAGPSGLQMAYFLQQAKRDYVVFERSNISGHFFSVYPKHRTLISINKRNTGQQNPDFNLRFDWNSLLSHDPSLLFKHFSRDYFPKADAMVKYLDTFRRKMNLQVQFDTEVRNVQKLADEGHNGYKFSLEDQRGNAYFCKILLVANGVSKPNVPDMPGIEMVTGYEDVSTNLDDFEAKTVMILGRGNAAFETANFIFPAANYVHMVGASPPRFAWSTHYVGDLRAVNNDILDNYQLKSLDGLLDADFTRLGFIRMKSGKLALTMRQDTNERYNYDKNYDYSYNYNYNKRRQSMGGKSYNYNHNDETERTTDPKKVSRCFSYNYNSRDNPKSYNYNYNNPEDAKSYNYNYNHPDEPKSYNYNYNIPENKNSCSDKGRDKTMCFSYNYSTEAMSDGNGNWDKTKSSNYNYNYPDNTKSYNYNYNNPDKMKSYNYNNPDKTKSYNYNYNNPDKTKSYNYNNPDETESYNYNYKDPDKTKAYNYNYNNPDKTKSYNYNYNNPDETKSYNYNYKNPDKTKSYNYNYNNPDKTKSYNYNYNNPDKTKSYNYNYNNPDETKSYNYNYNNPDKTKSYNYNYNNPDKTKSYNYNYNNPEKTKSYNYNYNNPDETKSYHCNNPDKTKSYNYNYNNPDKTKSYNYNYNNPDETKPYNYNNPDKTKSYNYNYNKPDKTKSYNYNYNNPDETKSYNYNYKNPDKTKSYNYNYNNPDKTKSYNYNYNYPDKTKSYNYNYNNPDETKSYNYNYNNPDKKSYNYNYNNPDKTKSYNYNYNNPDETKSNNYNYNYNNPDETKSYNYNYNDGGQKNETSDSSTNEDGEHREEYDAIIRCLGFGYDDSMFSPSTMPRRWEGPKKRYPLINADYESANVPGMYFVGSTVHSLDYREASGGFIHGFRYTTRVLHRLLEFKHEGVPWPSTRGPLVDLVSAVMKTINEASGIYQMHHFLAEVFIIDRKSMEFRHVPEYPLSLLKELAAKTGHEGTELMVLAMRLNPDFSGPRQDTFHENRATSDVDKAHLSNFLHPIIYYYDDISQAKVDPTNERNLVLPEPTKTHHVVEDFLIRWTSEHLHIAPLRQFVQSCLEVDLQRYRPADCLEKLMLKNESSPAPLSCLQLPEHVRPDVVVGYGGSYAA